MAIQSLIYPDNEFSWANLYDALFSPFFDMLGNMLSIDRVSGGDLQWPFSRKIH